MKNKNPELFYHILSKKNNITSKFDKGTSSLTECCRTIKLDAYETLKDKIHVIL